LSRLSQTHNALLAVDALTTLQAGADHLLPDIIRQGLDYQTPGVVRQGSLTLNLSGLNAYHFTAKTLRRRCCFCFSINAFAVPSQTAFHHQPIAQRSPNCRLETAYHRADKAIHLIVDLLAAP
jgi:hypothetical protein